MDRAEGKRQKEKLRETMRLRRSAIPPEERRAASQRISERIVREIVEPAWSEAERLSGPDMPVLCTYLPFRDEVDIRPVIAWCWERDVPVVAPAVTPVPGLFELYRVTRQDELVPNRWGIPEPRRDESRRWRSPARIAWVLVPGLAFDRRGGRLGYGGGYYDRFFERLLRERGALPRTIAPAYERQLVPEVPVEPHDVRIDVLVTESGTVETLQENS